MLRFAYLPLLVSSWACAKPAPPPRPAGHYQAASAWLCMPGRAGDPCDHDLDTTVIDGNGGRAVVPEVASAAPVDCFYIYPTVDLSLRPGNHDDFSDVSRIAMTTRAQVGRFGQVCSLYVPLYRQVTIGTYARGGDRLEAGLDLAYSDVAAAFREYLASYNHGHRIVVLGHSQGAEMAKRLLVDFFDRDPALRARLVVAMPIGGHLEVPVRKKVGGTFANLPVCSTPGETGCVIGYRSRRADDIPDEPGTPLTPGREEVCVNPGNLARPEVPAALDAVYLRSKHIDGTDGVTTPFVSYPALEVGRCIASLSGARVLGIEATTGPRKPPIDLDSALFARKLGTHVLDFQIAQDNLIAIVRQAEGR
jgi:hypothetical protein